MVLNEKYQPCRSIRVEVHDEGWENYIGYPTYEFSFLTTKYDLLWKVRDALDFRYVNMIELYVIEKLVHLFMNDGTRYGQNT